MFRRRGSAIPIVLVSLLLVTLIPLPTGKSIMTGPVVSVEVGAPMVHVGESTTVLVTVENYDGETYTPMDLVEVTLSAEVGTFDPESSITDVDGRCTFTYYAPDEVDAPTDVTITATAEQGVLDPTGSDEVKVTYRLEGLITGPPQIETGGEAENYVLKVTAGGKPVMNANVMPTVFGAGTLATYSRQTNATGEAVLTIDPGDNAGQINIMVQLGSSDYFSSAVSKAVNVVEELAPLRLEEISFGHSARNWGLRNLKFRLFRGDDPVPGQQVRFSTSEGYFLSGLVTTDAGGYANATLIVSAETDENVQRQAVITVSATDGAEQVSFEGTLNISGMRGNINLRIDPIPYDSDFQGLLFPGEYISHHPRVVRTTFYAPELMVDMSLVFDLINPTGETVYTDILATGIDTEEYVVDGKYYVHYQDPMNVYQVPADPDEGNYTFVYRLTSRNGVHTYSEMNEVRIGLDWVEDYKISIRSSGKDDWTFIYYFAGANDLTPYMDIELEDLESEAPNGEFKVYVYFDREDTYDDVNIYDGYRWDGVRKWDLEVGKENSMEMGHENSGDEDVLLDFMKWVADCSPTGHYCLVMNDHGKGYKGTCWDYCEMRDDIIGGSYDMNFMSPDDVRSALRNFKRDRRMVDVVTIAACGMSTIEVATRIAPYTSYMVASELPLYSRHGLVTEKVLEHLKGYDWATSPPFPFLVATDFVNGFIEESGGTGHDSTICVVETGYVEEFEIKINATMRTIYNNWDLLGESFTEAYDQTIRVPGPELGEFENGDLKDFLERLRDEFSSLILDPTARSAFNGVQDCLGLLEDMIVYLHSTDGLNGLILYMPMEPIDLDYYGFLYWDYGGISRFHTDYYSHCIKLYSGGTYYPQGGDGQQDEEPFT
ncbi:MAG: clostripain-related cysteine peptidase, partial [Thermoplasmatota archaeon]